MTDATWYSQGAFCWSDLQTTDVDAAKSFYTELFGLDSEETPVGEGDLAAQVEQAYLNVAAALDAVGGSFDDVAKLTVYVVDWSPEKLADLGAGVSRAADTIQGDPVRPTTLLGVAALGEPDLLVEVEAVAVLD